ncbi:permease [candidate division WOR-3 bacterium]|nr:permease [candidate division WOR-3 bacterium]
MKDNVKEMQRKGMIRDSIFLGITLIIAIILLLIFPNRRDAVITTSWKFLIEMIWILPAVMVLMGLFAVWMSKETVIKYLGKTSGIKGISLAILFGALPTGPLYVAFPMAAALIKKGARISNVIIFLSAWACIKIPQEMVELQFLGPKFMVSRLVLTIIFVVIMGVSVERIIERSNKKTAKSAK